MKSWNTVFQDVSGALGPDGGDAFLQFLKVLPEEVNQGRKVNLTVRPGYVPFFSGVQWR